MKTKIAQPASLSIVIAHARLALMRELAMRISVMKNWKDSILKPLLSRILSRLNHKLFHYDSTLVIRSGHICLRCSDCEYESKGWKVI